MRGRAFWRPRVDRPGHGETVATGAIVFTAWRAISSRGDPAGLIGRDARGWEGGVRGDQRVRAGHLDQPAEVARISRPVGPPGEVAPGKRDRPQATINRKPRMAHMLTNQPAGLGNVNARSMSRWSTHPMIMRDMDRTVTMNPTMVDMRNMPHWVDRSMWTETLDATGTIDYRRFEPLVATSDRSRHALDIRT